MILLLLAGALFRSLPGQAPWRVAAMGTKERDQWPLAAQVDQTVTEPR